VFSTSFGTKWFRKWRAGSNERGEMRWNPSHRITVRKLLCMDARWRSGVTWLLQRVTTHRAATDVFCFVIVTLLSCTYAVTHAQHFENDKSPHGRLYCCTVTESRLRTVFQTWPWIAKQEKENKITQTECLQDSVLFHVFGMRMNTICIHDYFFIFILVVPVL
jgi:hypothetical protein